MQSWRDCSDQKRTGGCGERRRRSRQRLTTADGSPEVRTPAQKASAWDRSDGSEEGSCASIIACSSSSMAVDG
jgi:hypothetical protein